MDSNTDTYSSQYSKIGGWLILLGIGIVLNPFRLIFSSYSIFSDVFSVENWNSFTTVNGIYYHKLWKPIIFFELSINIILFIFSLVILVLFFKKSKLFPKLWIINICTFLLFGIIDLLLCRQVHFIVEQGMNDFYQPIIQSFFTLGIWGTYLMKSKRVKDTFIN